MKKYFKHRIFILGVLLVVLICLAVWAVWVQRDKNTDAAREIIGSEAVVEQIKESRGDENEVFSLEAGEKTVYAKADANGNVKESTVETLMKDEEGEEFRHKEEYDEELPVSVKISYFLNDKEITAQKLAGRSGKVKIRFDYENISSVQENAEEAALTPFAVITALVLPSDAFSNVEIENGELISMEGQNLVVGYALPGVADYLQLENYEPTEDLKIPEYVEITADVTEFELDFTATVITNGIFEDLEEEDLADIEEMTDSMDELSDASKELVNGTSELYDGMKEFHSFIIDFAEAIGAVSEGAGALEEALKGQEDGEDTQPTESEIALMQTMVELGLTEEQQAQLMSSIQLVVTEKVTGAVTETLTSVQSGVKALHEGTEELFSASIELNDAFVEVMDAVKELKDGFAEFDQEGIKELKKLAGTELKTIVGRLRKLKETDTNWNIFSDTSEENSSVRIILETDEIKQ